MADTLARLRGVTARYDRVKTLDLVDLDLPEGRITALCGPNGSGTSTTLRVLRGLHKAEGGEVEVAGRPMRDWTPKDLTRAVAILSQSPDAPPELPVQNLVRLGSFAHRKRFMGQSGEDHAACARALEATGDGRHCRQAHRTTVGRPASARLDRHDHRAGRAAHFLDETTNHLDLSHAFEVLELVRRLNRAEGRSVVLVLHDLNMAMLRRSRRSLQRGARGGRGAHRRGADRAAGGRGLPHQESDRGAGQ